MKDRLPRKDCKCLCVQEDMFNAGYVYCAQVYYHASPFMNALEEEMPPGFYWDVDYVERPAKGVELWSELPDNISALIASTENRRNP